MSTTFIHGWGPELLRWERKGSSHCCNGRRRAKSRRPRPCAAAAAAGTQAPTRASLADETEQVVFPKPLTGVDRARRAVSFWTRVVPILVKYQMLRSKVSTGEFGQDQVDAMYEELHDWGATRLSETIQDLLGFYVKSGQVISSRVDLFPEQYTTKLQMLQDSLAPIPTSLIKAVISQELLEGEPLSTLFKSFDEEPLGSASIAQVHKAVLLDGRTVAVKVQRPGEEPKLRGDVGNLKAFAQRFRSQLPVDYYPVFCELERALTNELDFLAEAQSIEKIAAAVAHRPDGTASKPPLYVPRPIPGLVSKRVLVMEFVDGIALNKVAEKMESEGHAPAGPEVTLFGKILLESLSEAFGRMIFGPAFLHGDPHPGNIFVMENGAVALIDCGQVKQIPVSRKLQLADLILAVANWGTDNAPSVQELADLVKGFGVETEEGAGDECLAALALLLFGQPGLKLPGGYSNEELSKGSPLRRLTLFPQELVMLGRATVLIKGISSRVGIPWNLSAKWAEPAAQALACGEEGCMVPVYAAPPPPVGGELRGTVSHGDSRPRFAEVVGKFLEFRRYLWEWMRGKFVSILPGPLKRFLMKRAAAKIERAQRA